MLVSLYPVSVTGTVKVLSSIILVGSLGEIGDSAASKSEIASLFKIVDS